VDNGRVPLLLCDLDDTLVDRGRIFDTWAAEFAQMHGLNGDLAWLAALDGGGITPREDFWAAVKGRLRLASRSMTLSPPGGWTSRRCTGASNPCSAS
jgi:hypothetical protein